MHFVSTDDHAPESLYHLEGKGQIARWLKHRYPNLRVREEQRSNDEGERIADVMVTRADGLRVALEIQYAPLTPDAWLLRHESYRRQGITDVWLFGHQGRQLRPARGEGTTDRVALNPTQELVVTTGLPLLWFNPVLMEIGTAVDPILIDGRSWNIPAQGRTGRFLSEKLDAFELDEALGLSCPHLAAMHQAAAESERRRLKAAAIAAAATALQLVVERREREAATARAQKSHEQIVARSTAWLEVDDGVRLLADFDGKWPEWIGIATDVELQIPFIAWQGFLWDKMIRDRDDGDWIRRDECAVALYRGFGALDLSDGEVQTVIKQWFDVLVQARELVAQPIRLRRGRRAVKYLKTDRITQELRREECLNELRAVAAAREPANASERQTPPNAGHTPPGTPVCHHCGKPLDPLLASYGYHLRCDPGWGRR
jgi:hypothetical protein